MKMICFFLLVMGSASVFGQDTAREAAIKALKPLEPTWIGGELFIMVPHGKRKSLYEPRPDFRFPPREKIA